MKSHSAVCLSAARSVYLVSLACSPHLRFRIPYSAFRPKTFRSRCVNEYPTSAPCSAIQQLPASLLFKYSAWLGDIVSMKRSTYTPFTARRMESACTHWRLGNQLDVARTLLGARWRSRVSYLHWFLFRDVWFHARVHSSTRDHDVAPVQNASRMPSSQFLGVSPALSASNKSTPAAYPDETRPPERNEALLGVLVTRQPRRGCVAVPRRGEPGEGGAKRRASWGQVDARRVFEETGPLR
ncbi:hypothetical protein B0H17DRAFT_1147508 [Mycena rosella]|uniref:Uncharacterized protein n=1 Tax=Mycena rosella TaxID=1033263 RepID=A0AAD7CLF9_MYCRO|nr:hypothetical protein B0H17DRAFT_1147508 [Mycena rosella]